MEWNGIKLNEMKVNQKENRKTEESRKYQLQMDNNNNNNE